MSQSLEDVHETLSANLRRTEPSLAEEEEPGAGHKVASTLKRTATRVGERISELSEGRYGLATGSGKAEEKQGRKRLSRQERKAAKRAEQAARGSGLAWAIGLSLGLVAGLVSVAYWQRRRLQRLWGESAQRMQQATEELRRRFDAQRRERVQPANQELPPETRGAGEPGTASATGTLRPLGSASPVPDLGQQTDGRVESGA